MDADHPTQPNPYTILGIDPIYTISNAQIERAYLLQLGRAHPDRVGDAGSVDAAVFNESRDRLLDPEKRANVLLGIMGGRSASQDKSLPDGFLMEIMERRQEIEDDIESGDPSKREDWHRWAAGERDKFEQQIEEYFQACSRGAGTPDLETNLSAWRAALNAWRYIERLIEQLDPSYDPGQADFH